MKKLLAILSVLTVITAKSQTNYKNALKKTDFYRNISINTYWNKALVTNVPKKISFNSQNIGINIPFSLGVIYNKKYGFALGTFIGSEPFNYNIKFDYKDFNLGFGNFIDKSYVYIPTTGLLINTEYQKKITNNINLKIGIGINIKYFLRNGINRGAFHVINDSTDLNIYEININTENISKKGYLGYNFSIGIIKQIKKSNKYLFVEFVGNISQNNIAIGTVDFFKGENYEKNCKYIQRGHFIGLNIGLIFLSDK